jgi:hypothetical protein
LPPTPSAREEIEVQEPRRSKVSSRRRKTVRPAIGLLDSTIRGRPTSYKPEFVDQARKLCELGATDVDLADFFGVDARTIYRWQISHPEFCEALKVGKDVCDNRVERSLYHRAVGYTFDAEEVFQFQGKIVRAAVVKHVPPDTTAAIFWIKNRRRDQWRDRQELQHSGAVGLSMADLVMRSYEPADTRTAVPRPQAIETQTGEEET